MKKISNSIFNALLILLVLIGCREDSDEFRPYNEGLLPDQNSILAVDFDELRELMTEDYPIIEYTFKAEEGLSIWEADGFNCYISSNAFEDASGTQIGGEIIFRITRLRGIGDMMLWNKPTVTADKILTTDGSFLLEAIQDNQELSFIPGFGVNLTFPDETIDNNMSFWTGQEDSDGNFNWVEGNNSTNTNIVWANQQIESQNGLTSGYEIFTDELNWCNIDYLMQGYNEFSTCEVSIPENFTNVNAEVFLVFPNENAVVGLFGNQDNQNFDAGSYETPVGADVVLVVVGILTVNDVDQFYYATKSTTLGVNHKETFEELENISLNALKTKLSSFN